MIRKPMEIQDQAATQTSYQNQNMEQVKMSLSGEGPIFKLKDQTSRFEGVKL